MATSFPVGVRVVLKDLNAAQHNGKAGVVRSGPLANGRQNVFVEGDDKIMALRAGNMQLEPRDADTLSIRELKIVLGRKRSNGDLVSLTTAGMDKSDLQRSVSQLCTPEETAQILAEAAGKESDPAPGSASAPTMSKAEIERQADVMSEMSPDQLRQQAAMMRSMDPSTLRRMNPQMAGMSDAQIKFAADQLEMMAGNPSLMKQAADQMKQMSSEELERQRRAVMSGNTPAAAASSSTPPPAQPSPSPAGSSVPKMSKSQIEQQADLMSEMSPDQLRQQAAMMRAMDPAALRRMDPQLAGMSDSQIRFAADQLEMMASDPSMMRMAAEQVKNMSPEQLERQRKQAMTMMGNNAPATNISSASNAASTPSRTASSTSRSSSKASVAGTASSMPADPAQMLNHMSPEQLRQQAEMLKSMSPDQLRRMSPQFRNMSDEQIRAASAQMEMLASNPDMMKVAAEYMKNMSPDDIRAMHEGRIPAGTAGGNPTMSSMDPSSLDAKQLKGMMQMLKGNLELLKQMLGSRADGMSDEQLQKTFEAFDRMDEKQLERALSVMTGLQKMTQPFRSAYDKTNRAVGGHLWKILLLLATVGAVAVVYLVLAYLVLSRGSTAGAATNHLDEPAVIDPIPDVEFEDEF